VVKTGKYQSARTSLCTTIVDRRAFSHHGHRLERLGRSHLEVRPGDVLPVGPHERPPLPRCVGRAIALVVAKHVLQVIRLARAEARERLAQERKLFPGFPNRMPRA